MRRRAMRTFDYEPPELAEAKFSEFVQGASAPGKAEDNDQVSEDLF